MAMKRSSKRYSPKLKRGGGNTGAPDPNQFRTPPKKRAARH